MHKIIRAIFLALVASAVGCGDDAPTGGPTVVGALAECRDTGDDAGFKLTKVEVVIRDLDGPDDIANVSVMAEGAVSLTMQRQEPMASDSCPSGRRICQVSYTWQSSPTNESLFCGAEGNALQLAIEVVDASGKQNVAAVQSNPN